MSGLPEGWVKTTLGNNIVDIAMGPFGSNLKVDSFIETGVPVIKGGNLSENFVGGSFSFVSEEKATSLRRSVAHAGDIIVTHRGTLGQVSLVPTGEYERYVTSQSQLRFTPDKQKVDKNYLLYFLKSRIGQYELLLNASQVGVPAIATPTKAMKEINLCLPPLPEQKAIADMLSSFDEKIELLREQNKTLETLAQTIFKEWFVNFNYPDATGEMVDSELGKIPKGWRTGKLGEFLKMKSGFAFKSKDFVESGSKKALKIKDLKGKGKVDIGNISSVDESSTNSKRVQLFKLDAGDIVLAMSGNTTGKIGIIPEHSHSFELYLNQRVGKFFFEDSEYKNFTYVFLMTGDFEKKILNMGYGSAQPNINPSQIENIEIIIPDKITFHSFNRLVEPTFEKMNNNTSQIQSLSKTRDTLLPRLMSGEVRIEAV